MPVDGLGVDALDRRVLSPRCRWRGKPPPQFFSSCRRSRRLPKVTATLMTFSFCSRRSRCGSPFYRTLVLCRTPTGGSESERKGLQKNAGTMPTKRIFTMVMPGKIIA